ncbi:MAG: hypothetical protein WA077_10000, partial [Anaerolineae bacterium]
VVAIATATLAPVPATPAVAENTVNPPVAGATVTPAGTRTQQGQTTNLPTATPLIVIVTATPLPTATAPPRPSPTPKPTNTTAPPTPKPTQQPAVTPCPSYLHKPKPGMGLLLIENHLGEPLHIDQANTPNKWDLPAKQGDIPGRLLLDLSPGDYDFIDNTASGYGHIRITITPGSAFISPIWYNDRTEELVYPLDIPNGCR